MAKRMIAAIRTFWVCYDLRKRLSRYLRLYCSTKRDPWWHQRQAPTTLTSTPSKRTTTWKWCALNCQRTSRPFANHFFLINSIYQRHINAPIAYMSYHWSSVKLWILRRTPKQHSHRHLERRSEPKIFNAFLLWSVGALPAMNAFWCRWNKQEKCIGEKKHYCDEYNQEIISSRGARDEYALRNTRCIRANSGGVGGKMWMCWSNISDLLQQKYCWRQRLNISTMERSWTVTFDCQFTHSIWIFIITVWRSKICLDRLLSIELRRCRASCAVHRSNTLLSVHYRRRIILQDYHLATYP